MGIREEEIIGQVRSAIAHDPLLGTTPRISITMLDDGLALTGIVDDPELASRAEMLARQAAPGVRLDNSLTVAPASFHVTDKQMRQSAMVALQKAVDAIHGRPARVSVQLENGIAHLQGACATLKDRRFLVSAVARVDGIRRVAGDGLAVSAVGGADDIRLGNLASAMLRDAEPGLYAAVTVTVKDRAARLIGRVRNPYERSRVDDLVSQVPGIAHVHNALELYQHGKRSDGEAVLEQEAIHALARAGLPAPNLHVYVTSGLLVLDGEVETIDQARRAGEVARSIGLIERIDNRLKVAGRRGSPPLPESDLQRD